ncbi:hypothetical protein CU098_000182, partial [Rhizopus stolonifer]
MPQQSKRKGKLESIKDTKKAKHQQSSIMSFFDKQSKTVEHTIKEQVQKTGNDSKQEIKLENNQKQETSRVKLEIEQRQELDSTQLSKHDQTDDQADDQEDIRENTQIDDQQDTQTDDQVDDQEETREETQEDQFFTTSMYTDEVNHMLDTVLEGEAYLFDKEEIQLFDTYRTLEGNEPKHLIVRLLMRKHDWIRKSRVNYANNIRDLDIAMMSLEACGFLHTKITELEDAVAVLSKYELKEIVRERHIGISHENPTKKNLERGIIKFVSSTTPSIVTHYSDASVDQSKTEKIWCSVHYYLGPCLKVNTLLYQVFQRLQLVYYRINSLLDTNKMSTSILAKTSKRNYPQYTSNRSNCIWNSRDDLLQYEQALMIEKEYHLNMERLFIFKTKKIEGDNTQARQQMIENWALCENCIGVWEDCIHSSQVHQRPYYLRRFEAGWIYTRLLDHGTELLAKLKEYELEALVLQKLLDQHMYRLGKRGKWYERLALVQANYLHKDQVRLQKKKALGTCINAIHDPRVHQIYLHGIFKRIRQLEKDLCVPKREQHDFSYMNLKKPKEITIYGMFELTIWLVIELLFEGERISEEIIGKKSIWRGDDGSECSVEKVAIEYYQKQGYKGLHCENGIIRMIVSVVVCSTIHSCVFETPYQSEPLDLRIDAFYESKSQDKKGGKHIEIITQVDNRERPRRTMCVGINWNYELQDILEIAECIGPLSLASLCKLFFEEFGQ